MLLTAVQRKVRIETWRQPDGAAATIGSLAAAGIRMETPSASLLSKRLVWRVLTSASDHALADWLHQLRTITIYIKK